MPPTKPRFLSAGTGNGKTIVTTAMTTKSHGSGDSNNLAHSCPTRGLLPDATGGGAGHRVSRRPSEWRAASLGRLRTELFCTHSLTVVLASGLQGRASCCCLCANRTRSRETSRPARGRRALRSGGGPGEGQLGMAFPGAMEPLGGEVTWAEVTWLLQLALPEAMLGHMLWALDFGMDGLSGKPKATGTVSVLLCDIKSQKGEI